MSPRALQSQIDEEADGSRGKDIPTYIPSAGTIAMAWDHLDVDKPHLAYMILGGFTSLFMLCSLFIKEKLYIGEATVAFVCGLIFGPHAADLLNPTSWGNVDKITLEASRIVLVVQCFAVGVELPKSYMERHWKSVTLLLLPVMTYGWLITSLFIWWMVPPLTFVESLACAACVTATDPVLASSVVGKGKFAKRVPKHLRDLLSAESGCNDGMAFPFIYLSVYIMRYNGDANHVALHWFCVTILYECIVGAFFGFMIGYIARHAIKFSEKKGVIDRESLLVFYFVLALFCAGAGSLLGMDDLLIGFSAGVGFSNDGWFTKKTEESHVSNVIDLLLNLTYFVYLGAIFPWDQFDYPSIGLVPWRLVVIAILVIFFRRIPIMLALKPVIPDIKSWREALFAGHFGPIGVGAIFACILTRAELETESTQPVSLLPKPGEHDYIVISAIWPIVTFVVISSILVHGSSIAVFTLGKQINTLTITMSYTQGPDEEASWMNRLPRIQSVNSRSLKKTSLDESTDKPTEYPSDTLGPMDVPKNFLRRQKDKEEEEEQEDEQNGRPSSRKSERRKSGFGGPISESAIVPQRRQESVSPAESTTLNGGEDRAGQTPSPPEEDTTRGREEPAEEGEERRREPELEVYQEGPRMVIEDEEGNVLETRNMEGMSPEDQRHEIMEQHRRLQEDTSGEMSKSKSHPHERAEGKEHEEAIGKKMGHPYARVKNYLTPLVKKSQSKESPKEEQPESSQKKRTQGLSHAFQFGNTVIVEDDDGEVIKKFDISDPAKEQNRDLEAQVGEAVPGTTKQPPKRRMSLLGAWPGHAKGEASGEASGAQKQEEGDPLDSRIRFTVADEAKEGEGAKGRRMNKDDFFQVIRQLDPKSRRELLLESNAEASGARAPPQQDTGGQKPPRQEGDGAPSESETGQPPSHEMTAAESQRRRLAGGGEAPLPTTLRERRDSEDDGTERVPPALLREQAGLPPSASKGKNVDTETGETPAEQRRRLAALGVLDTPSDADSEGGAEEGTGAARARASASSGGNGSGSGTGDGNGNGDHGLGRRRHISWGGERGRNP